MILSPLYEEYSLIIVFIFSIREWKLRNIYFSDMKWKGKPGTSPPDYNLPKVENAALRDQFLIARGLVLCRDPTDSITEQEWLLLDGIHRLPYLVGGR